MGVRTVSESDSSQGVWLENLVYDLRYALRSLTRNPGFALAVIGTLALGIGANTAIFSVVNAALLRPFPYKNAERVVWATEFFPKFNRPMVLAPEYAAWKRQNTAFEQLEAYGTTIGVNLTSGKQTAQRVRAGHVTPGFFKMLGVPPRVGRWFSSEDSQSGHDHLAVLSERLWQDYFHSDPHIVGRPVVLNGIPYSVIGVMPSGLLYPGGLDAAVWLPDAVHAAATVPARNMGVISVVGRLKHGVSIEKARANLEVIARGMDSQYPVPWAGYHGAATVRVVSLQQQLTASSKTALYVLMGAVGFILLIVCANVANLFVARALTREREFAIRAAIGASRSAHDAAAYLREPYFRSARWLNRSCSELYSRVGDGFSDARGASQPHLNRFIRSRFRAALFGVYQPAVRTRSRGERIQAESERVSKARAEKNVAAVCAEYVGSCASRAFGDSADRGGAADPKFYRGPQR